MAAWKATTLISTNSFQRCHTYWFLHKQGWHPLAHFSTHALPDYQERTWSKVGNKCMTPVGYSWSTLQCTLWAGLYRLQGMQSLKHCSLMTYIYIYINHQIEVFICLHLPTTNLNCLCSKSTCQPPQRHRPLSLAKGLTMRIGTGKGLPHLNYQL